MRKDNAPAQSSPNNLSRLPFLSGLAAANDDFFT
jgi:hypothetical protein